MVRKTLIAGNWKMHNNKAAARELIDGITYGIKELDADKGFLYTETIYKLKEEK